MVKVCDSYLYLLGDVLLPGAALRQLPPFSQAPLLAPQQAAATEAAAAAAKLPACKANDTVMGVLWRTAANASLDATRRHVGAWGAPGRS